MNPETKNKLFEAITKKDIKTIKSMNLDINDYITKITKNKNIFEVAYHYEHLDCFKYFLNGLYKVEKAKKNKSNLDFSFDKNKENNFAYLYEMSKKGYIVNGLIYNIKNRERTRTIIKAICTCLVKKDEKTLNYLRLTYFKNDKEIYQDIMDKYTKENRNVLKNKLEKLETSLFQKEPTKYNGVQCVAFNVSTKNSKTNYYGFKNDKQDWKNRVHFISEAVESSFKCSKINRNVNCLKVFMVPEFFFRGTKGAYDMDTTSDITEALRKVVNKPKYKDWLFVFGTTVGYSINDIKEAENQYTAYNFSFVQKGNSGEKESLVVLKENKSGIDFISKNNAKPGMLNSRNTKYLEVISSDEKRSEEKKKNYDGYSVFEIGGIRFGLEICLDNITKRIDLSKTKLKNPLDVQLITSCGVNKPRISNQLKEKGLVFFVDGQQEGKSEVLDKYGNTPSPIAYKPFISSDKDISKKLFNSDCSINVFPTKLIKKEINISKTKKNNFIEKNNLL